MDRRFERVPEVLERIVAVLSLAIAHAALPAIIVLGVLQILNRNFRWGAATGYLELQAILFFALVVTSFAYGYVRDAHVRIDTLGARFPARTAAVLEMIGALAVVTPLCLILVLYGAESAWRSFQQGETLGGTDLAIGWLARATVPAGFVLLQLAALARFLRNARTALGSGERTPR